MSIIFCFILVLSSCGTIFAQPPLPHPWVPRIPDPYCESTPAAWPINPTFLEGNWYLVKFHALYDVPTTSCGTVTIEESGNGGWRFDSKLRWNNVSFNKTAVGMETTGPTGWGSLGRWQYPSPGLFCAHGAWASDTQLIFLSSTYTEERTSYETVLYMTCGLRGSSGWVSTQRVEVGVLSRSPNSLTPEIWEHYLGILQEFEPYFAENIKDVSHTDCA